MTDALALNRLMNRPVAQIALPIVPMYFFSVARENISKRQRENGILYNSDAQNTAKSEMC